MRCPTMIAIANKRIDTQRTHTEGRFQDRPSAARRLSMATRPWTTTKVEPFHPRPARSQVAPRAHQATRTREPPRPNDKICTHARSTRHQAAIRANSWAPAPAGCERASRIHHRPQEKRTIQLHRRWWRTGPRASGIRTSDTATTVARTTGTSGNATTRQSAIWTHGSNQTRRDHPGSDRPSSDRRLAPRRFKSPPRPSRSRRPPPGPGPDPRRSRGGGPPPRSV